MRTTLQGQTSGTFLVLAEVAKIHPTISIVVLAYKAALQIELTRRENDRKVLAVYLSMRDMMEVLLRLQDIDPSGDHGRDVTAFLAPSCQLAVEDIKRCANACDKYHSQRSVVRFLKAEQWATTFQGMVGQFQKRREEFIWAITLSISKTISSIQSRVTTYQDMIEVETQAEKDLERTLDRLPPDSQGDSDQPIESDPNDQTPTTDAEPIADETNDNDDENASLLEEDEHVPVESLQGFESDDDPRIPLLLRIVLHDTPAELQLAELDDTDSQHMIDRIQRIFDTSAFHEIARKGAKPKSLRRIQIQLRRILLRLSMKHQALPGALFLSDVTCQDTESVGSGGFADVLFGTHREQKVALKRLRVFQMADPSKRSTMKKSFCRESLLWRNLSHPNILQLLGIEQHLFKGTLCMVSPWMEHGSIRHAIDRLKHQPEYQREDLFSRVQQWIIGMAEGLTYLHEEGLVHGDLRGANVLLDSTWTVKLADFGLSVIADASATSTSAHGGALRWLAPEIFDPESFNLQTSRPTYASDVYSFATTVIELYTSEAPFGTSFTDVAIMRRVALGRRPERPRFHDGDLMSDELWALLERAWAQEPQDRIPSGEVLETLRNLRITQDATVTTL
ncbi:hypothetical protein EIP91_008748 [Steccherinum ochraceum]|uniref:Protein kinase domain-containing protein n=1 Tax=Steccherinum ochraceum TaxID=92696 RepID=A0A4R0RN72_9APHY|nr:hypothetical protein EIP91_008748 [Steccherinum ochraceum]